MLSLLLCSTAINILWAFLACSSPKGQFHTEVIGASRRRGRRVKGKQVQILYDLVTVIGEYEATRFTAQSLTAWAVGKAALCIDPSARKPAERLVQRPLRLRPRGIGRIVLRCFLTAYPLRDYALYPCG